LKFSGFFLEKDVDFSTTVVYCLVMILRKTDDPRYKINLDKKVFVYKNLHKGCWSIKQGGLVKAHSTGEDIVIRGAMMKVNRKGREKVIREKRKNVHAGIVGHLAKKDEWLTWINPVEISYNPYRAPNFYETKSGKVRWISCAIVFKPNKVLAHEQ
jgi:hypothetical protein